MEIAENSAFPLASFDDKGVDISDIIEGFGGSNVITPIAVFGHEITEQTEAQNPDNANMTSDERYEFSHIEASAAENAVGQYERMEKKSGSTLKGGNGKLINTVKKSEKIITRTVEFKDGKVIKTNEEER